MRTTITIDPDLARTVERLRRQRGLSMARVVNELLRAGIRGGRGARKRYTLRANWRATSLIGSLDSVSRALDIAEGPSHR